MIPTPDCRNFVCECVSRNDGEPSAWCRSCHGSGLIACDMPLCGVLATVDEGGIPWCDAHAGQFDEDDVWPEEPTVKLPTEPVDTSEGWRERLKNAPAPANDPAHRAQRPHWTTRVLAEVSR